MTIPHRAPGAPHVTDRERGFAVIAVLIVLSLMLSLGLTYMQHTALASDSSPADREMVQAGEDVASGLDYARTRLAAGRGTGTNTLTVGGQQVTVSTAELTSEGHLRWELVSKDSNDLGSTLLAESEHVPAPGDTGIGHPDLLPSIEDEVVKALLTDPDVPITAYSGNVTLEDVEIDGLLVLETNAKITVRNVIVNGAIVSRQALETDAVGDYNDVKAPQLIIDGSLLVKPSDALSGVAILMPDGKIGTSAGLEESFQLLGAVVAHTIELAATGTVDGAIAFSELVLSDDVQRPGYGRTPLELPDVLEAGSAREQAFFAVVPLNQTAAELTAVTGFWSGDGDK